VTRRALRFLAFLTALSLATPAAATNLPAGFVEDVLAQLTAPMSMAWGPDGALWVGGGRGNVWLLRLGSGPRAPLQSVVEVAQLPVSAQGERGTLGIAVDPDYPLNRHVWIYYSNAAPPVRNRLSRFRHVGDQLVEETVILESEDLANDIHNGGCLRFASDKTLYLSTGDDSSDRHASPSQNPRVLKGKILHINRDGSPAAGNPFLDGRNGDPRVWALGLRNPWRFSLQPGSETLFIADVGAGAFEEINLGTPGADYGWPVVEGELPPGVPGVTYPLYAYPHTSPLGHAVIDGGHAPALNFPPEFEGNYFFGDAITREIFRMVLDASAQVVSVEVFASDLARGPVDIQFGPDGMLYYLEYNEGRVGRISHVGGSNRQPAARAELRPDNGQAPLEVILDASASSDPDGDPLRYRWDLGDGTQSEDPVVRKRYAEGVFLAGLAVSDGRGGLHTSSGLRIVSGNSRPAALIQEPRPGRAYFEGETIVFAGQGIDPEEGVVPCERLDWRIIFHHAGHTHPFLAVQGTCNSTFVIDSHGEEDTFFEILLTVADSGEPLGAHGTLTGTASLAIHPRGAGAR
jgi:glucose/arabinose dehydrogenase